MKYLLTLFYFLSLSFALNAQFNDTIYYASGMKRTVEIIDFDKNTIKFNYLNSDGDTLVAYVGIFPVTHFVCYDDLGILQYDSKSQTIETFQARKLIKSMDSCYVSPHQVSINLIGLPFAIFNGHYAYTFGSKMQFSILTRLTYTPQLFYYSDYVWQYGAGLGFKFTPYYSHYFSLGIDITPVIAFKPKPDIYTYVYVPLSLDLQFFISSRFGLAIDFGAGQVFHDKDGDILLRGNVGMTWQFGPKIALKQGY